MASSHAKASSSFAAAPSNANALDSLDKSRVSDEYLEEVEEVKLLLKKSAIHRQNIGKLHKKTTPPTKIKDQAKLDATLAQIASEQAEFRRLNAAVTAKLDVFNAQDDKQQAASADPYSVQRMRKNVTLSLNKMLSDSLLTYQEESAVHRETLRSELQKSYAAYAKNDPDVEDAARSSAQTVALKNTKTKLDNLDSEIRAVNAIFQQHAYCAPQNQNPDDANVEKIAQTEDGGANRSHGIGFCGACCGFFGAIGFLFWTLVTSFFAIIGFVIFYKLFFV